MEVVLGVKNRGSVSTGLLLQLLPADERDHCCPPLCLTFTEQHLWPQATALATMNTSLLNTCSPAEYLGGPVAKLGCVKLPTDSGHSTTVNLASLHDTSTAGLGC